MWNKIQYALLFGWMKSHAILPMRMLYFLSDILYVLIYRVVRYRVRVVRSNMKASFPDKSEKELRKMESDFYHHFSDYIVETMKLGHISLEEINKRAVINNPEVIDELTEKGHTCFVLLMGHYANWEWYTASASFMKDVKIYQIYRPLNNKAVDKLFIYLRTRFGSKGIKKQEAVRDIVKLKKDKTRSLVIFLADQTPSRANLHFWTEFLNQDSAIITGPERIARKMNLPVVFLDTKETKRGYYTIDMRLISEHSKDTPENYITQTYIDMLNRCIMRNPALWLWSHKRWKYKREDKE